MPAIENLNYAAFAFELAPRFVHAQRAGEFFAQALRCRRARITSISVGKMEMKILPRITLSK